MPNEFSVRLVPAKMAGVVSPRGGGGGGGGGGVGGGKTFRTGEAF